MTWQYQQSTGTLTCDSIFEGTGYSGTGIGRNSPTMQDTADVGPIPVGTYKIEGAINSEKLGPCVMPLTPIAGDEMFGRAGFYIHGNNAANDASHGCIILGPAIRRMIAASADRTLVVVS